MTPVYHSALDRSMSQRWTDQTSAHATRLRALENSNPSTMLVTKAHFDRRGTRRGTGGGRRLCTSNTIMIYICLSATSQCLINFNTVLTVIHFIVIQSFLSVFSLRQSPSLGRIICTAACLRAMLVHKVGQNLACEIASFLDRSDFSPLSA